MKISLTLPEELLNDLDIVCTKEKYERSEFIRDAIRDRIYPKGIQKVPDVVGEIDLEGVASDTYTATYGSTNIPTASTTRENRWCDCHFEKGVKYDCLLITWEDENGVAVVDKKFACPKCVEKYENMGRGHLYFL